MKTFTSLKCAAVLLPALAMGIPMANADDEKRNDPCEHERTTAVTGTDRAEQRAEQRVAQNKATAAQARSAAESARAKANEAVHNQYVETMPVRGFHSDSLVGHKVKNRRSNETVGEISNLLMDENGQVVAAIISVGGVLGIGERDVAIAWDQIERKADGDDITLTVDLTEESLKDAPKYSSEVKISRQ